MTVKTEGCLRRYGLAAMTLALTGCSVMPSFGNLSTQQASASSLGPQPRVQNCGIVSISSPTKYVCNGKVYTSFDLANLRQDWEKKHTAEP